MFSAQTLSAYLGLKCFGPYPKGPDTLCYALARKKEQQKYVQSEWSFSRASENDMRIVHMIEDYGLESVLIRCEETLLGGISGSRDRVNSWNTLFEKPVYGGLFLSLFSLCTWPPVFFESIPSFGIDIWLKGWSCSEKQQVSAVNVEDAVQIVKYHLLYQDRKKNHFTMTVPRIQEDILREVNIRSKISDRGSYPLFSDYEVFVEQTEKVYPALLWTP